MNFRALYNDGRDKQFSAQDIAEARQMAANMYPVKLFTVEPMVTNRECVKLLNNINKRFSDACEAETSGEERNAVMRLLLCEVSTLCNDYWIEGNGEDPIDARDLARDLSSRISDVLE